MRESVTPEPCGRSACLIYNPVAGQGDAEADLRLIRSFLEPVFDLDIRFTTPEVGANALACAAVERGTQLVIASGGDGTLSAAAEALVGTGIPFGVISRGTANAFANALGLPLTLELACEAIIDGATRAVDVATCNGLPMVLLAGIGFEAEAVARTSREAKNWFGTLAYVWSGLQQLAEMQSFWVAIETPDLHIQTTATAITIANAAPPTSVLAQGCGACVFDDGLLDITVVAPNSAMEALAAAFDLFSSAVRAAALDRPDVGHLLAPWVRVVTDPPQVVAIDGEVVARTPLEVVCVPGGLRVIVPVDDLLEPHLAVEYLDLESAAEVEPLAE
ncbi:YegS/Rv2252/BmrU family lipid kinase [Gloeobacter morelensis]|uniref:YegS/Rv2252/BmrU family lipid kinase n=1 Tax=Gloeobacter morelensis MG652769 TaxID=2781736 RepID=A0ABY3PHD7_9CYAN|nr:YegS/Rv2252/BmrU family lipid kinase [Gloeobacter morelensis]UFP93091.1 YegS/Rv2252/BmrU family lipid kinase [Gloeobacter morelensis MG652769]